MRKINEWWTNIKKYNFEEAAKILNSYEKDHREKGCVEFEVYMPSEQEEKMIKIVKIVIFALMAISFLLISSFIYKEFSQSGFEYYIIIFFVFIGISITLCLLFPDKTKYVESLKVSENYIIIKLQDTKKYKDKVYKYDFKNCTLDFKRHYHRKSENGTSDEDGMIIIINGNKFLIKNTYKYIELNVFKIYVTALKNGINAREELAKIYKW